jgi:hypothetical protein
MPATAGAPLPCPLFKQALYGFQGQNGKKKIAHQKERGTHASGVNVEGLFGPLNIEEMKAEMSKEATDAVHIRLIPRSPHRHSEVIAMHRCQDKGRGNRQC